jgi:hypothetical protein
VPLAISLLMSIQNLLWTWGYALLNF